MLSTNASWRQGAACRGLDPRIFFPSEDDGGEEAKAVCRMCPVRPACLDYALAQREREGIWGGTTEVERRRMVRHRRRTA